MQSISKSLKTVNVKKGLTDLRSVATLLENARETRSATVGVPSPLVAPFTDAAKEHTELFAGLLEVFQAASKSEEAIDMLLETVGAELDALSRANLHVQLHYGVELIAAFLAAIEAGSIEKKSAGFQVFPSLLRLGAVSASGASVPFFREVHEAVLELVCGCKENKTLLFQDYQFELSALFHNLFKCGDAGIQLTLTEILFRLCPKKPDPKQAFLLSTLKSAIPVKFGMSLDAIITDFSAIGSDFFASDSRRFINQLNTCSQDLQRRPISLRGASIVYKSATDHSLKPFQDIADYFWIDFNVSCVSCTISKDDLPYPIQVSLNMVSSWKVYQQKDQDVCLELYLRHPLVILDDHSGPQVPRCLVFVFPSEPQCVSSVQAFIERYLADSNVSKFKTSVSFDIINCSQNDPQPFADLQPLFPEDISFKAEQEVREIAKDFGEATQQKQRSPLLFANKPVELSTASKQQGSAFPCSVPDIGSFLVSYETNAKSPPKRKSAEYSSKGKKGRGGRKKQKQEDSSADLFDEALVEVEEDIKPKSKHKRGAKAKAVDYTAKDDFNDEQFEIPVSPAVVEIIKPKSKRESKQLAQPVEDEYDMFDHQPSVAEKVKTSKRASKKKSELQRRSKKPAIVEAEQPSPIQEPIVVEAPQLLFGIEKATKLGAPQASNDATLFAPLQTEVSKSMFAPLQAQPPPEISKVKEVHFAPLATFHLHQEKEDAVADDSGFVEASGMADFGRGQLDGISPIIPTRLSSFSAIATPSTSNRRSSNFLDGVDSFGLDLFMPLDFLSDATLGEPTSSTTLNQSSFLARSHTDKPRSALTLIKENAPQVKKRRQPKPAASRKRKTIIGDCQDDDLIVEAFMLLGMAARDKLVEVEKQIQDSQVAFVDALEAELKIGLNQRAQKSQNIVESGFARCQDIHRAWQRDVSSKMGSMLATTASMLKRFSSTNPAN